MQGLNEKEVLERRKKYGTNKIDSKEKDSILKLFLSTLGDPIIKILLIALLIKTIFLFKDFNWFETLGIVIAIFISSLISTLSEYGNEIAFEKLEEENQKIMCKVIRENNLKEINIDEVVVDDIIFLESGDKIPADGIIVKGSLSIDESSMNGETKEQRKNKEDQVYRGTIVVDNEAYMLVKATGNNTYFGKMHKDIEEKKINSPLKIRLESLAKLISKIGYISAILVSISFLVSKIVINNNFNLDLIINDIKNLPLIFSYILHALTLSVTIIVVAVPEGLPMMITLVLSSNMKKMLKDNVLIRKMTGIETAGNINILFTDKTGTITKGKMEVTNYTSPTLKDYTNIESIKKYKNLYTHIENNCLYNNSSEYDIEGNITGGNITDKAILRFIPKIKKKYQVTEKKPFNSTNKYSSATINDITYLKGSYEVLLPKCNYYMDEEGKINKLINKQRIENKINILTKKGIRVILLAAKRKDSLSLIFLGLLSIKDEIRDEAKEEIKTLSQAGIKTIMITGDNLETAKSIAKECNLITNNNDLALESKTLESMSDYKIKSLLPNLKVIARAMPKDKSRLVKIAQDLNLVVGMTGDGVNDAPALKKADVGFAMGSGTEVAKEASDIIILDNNLKSISKAVLYGRTIFKSIRKFIIFQLTINICAVGISIIGPFINISSPVTVIQMLWINMIMDTLAGIAFSFEPPLKEYMKEQPKSKNEQIINKYMIKEILITGTYSFLLCIFFLKSSFIKTLYRTGTNNKYLMTAFFLLFILISIFNSFNARTNRVNIFKDVLKNKVFLLIIIAITIIQLYIIYYGGNMFRSFGLTLKELEITTLLALTVIPVDIIRKIILNKKHQNTGV